MMKKMEGKKMMDERRGMKKRYMESQEDKK